MKLNDLINYVNYTELIGDTSQEVNTLETDSRKVKPGTAFIAQRGLHVDGHFFIEGAVKNGAVAVFCEFLPTEIGRAHV